MRLILSLLAAAAMIGIFSQSAQSADPLLAQIKVKKRASDNYYILAVDSKGVHCSKNANGNPKTVIPLSQIDNLQFRMPLGWEDAMALQQARQYEKAAAAFAAIAKDYAAIAPFVDSPSALASYWAIDAYRRSGNYKEVNQERVRAMARNVSLSERYKDEMEIFRAWGHIGSQAWKELLLVVNDWELPLSTSGKIPPPATPPFKPLPANLVSQLAFLRATANEHLKNDALALVDYARVYTVDAGREEGLTRLSMLGALRLLKRHPEISFQYTVQKQAHALAVLFNERFQNSLPKEFDSFLTPPVMPETSADAAPEK
ncbi:MAG: hypothetical protein KDN22_09275 [Verrucomicrobiae bacterium]|nr:hypothetical protein [Verrucomicrobiae bacterium]